MNELVRRPLPHMTADEFLLWPGDGTGRRHHLVDGDVVFMSPASSTHGAIQANLSGLMRVAARVADRTLQVITEGAIVPALFASDNVRVPDIVVRRGRTTPGEIAVPDPVVIVEVLSPGNAPVTPWSRGDNVRAYATLASVREIVVVSTSRLEIEVHRRADSGAWPKEPEIARHGGILTVRAVGLSCPVEEVYGGTWLVET